MIQHWWITHNQKQSGLIPHSRNEQRSDSLGTLLMALSGRRTLTVRMAVRLMFCRSSEYSTTLHTHTHTLTINTQFICTALHSTGGVLYIYSSALFVLKLLKHTHTAGLMISNSWSYAQHIYIHAHTHTHTCLSRCSLKISICPAFTHWSGDLPSYRTQTRHK